MSRVVGRWPTLFVLLAAFEVPQVAAQEDLGDTQAFEFVVADVRDDQLVVSDFSPSSAMDVPVAVRLWGLDIVDDERYNAFMIGRKLKCQLLSIEGGLVTGVCHAGLHNTTRFPGPGAGVTLWPDETLFLFNWLPEMGIAARRCQDPGRSYYASDSVVYVCDDAGRSFTSVVVE